MDGCVTLSLLVLTIALREKIDFAPTLFFTNKIPQNHPLASKIYKSTYP
jgi:hypothetical protein